MKGSEGKEKEKGKWKGKEICFLMGELMGSYLYFCNKCDPWFNEIPAGTSQWGKY